MSADTSGSLTLPPLSERDRTMYRGGIWLLLVAEAMIFVTVFSSRFLLAGTARAVGPLNPIGLGITIVLIVSLWPAWRAKQSIVNDDAAGMGRNLTITGWLGIVVLAAILFDWTHLAFNVGSRFGESYVVSTGYHAVHIVIGCIWLMAAATAGRRGVYSRANHWVVEGGLMFWAFVVAMWVALYLVFFVA